MTLLRISRVCGQTENVAGYRKSFYQEDDDRIKVVTDSVHFDVGLRSNVRVTGEFVTDAISGATPTGAPPQSQWPLVTYNNLYQTAYHASYTSQYNQFIAENQIFVDGGLITYQQLTNSAADFARSTAGAIATNNANASYQQLTNSPHFHSTSVPLTYMHDFRRAGSIAAPVTFGANILTPSFAYSKESDYISYVGALNYSRLFNDKNTTLSLGWAHNQDIVRDDRFIWQDKLTDSGLIGLIQLFGPKAYLTLNASYTAERGYLSDPYRGVMPASFLQSNPEDAALIPEKRPPQRNTGLLYASWTQFVTPLNGSYELTYRFFADSYGIVAHTVGLTWNQKLFKQLVISPLFRYYVQSAASFYYAPLVPDTPALPAYYSSDYRLSELETFAAGVNITWRVQKYLSLDAGYMRYAMQGLDGVTSQSAYSSANIYNIGLRVWF